MRAGFVAIAVLCLFAATAFAWGPSGHCVVAQIAQTLVNPAATKITDGILAYWSEKMLADTANWPDQFKGTPGGKWSAHLHFVDMPAGSTIINLQEDCVDGCVISSIQNYTRLLSKGVEDDLLTNQYLSFLVHFVGDVHQPLHVGWASDLGGNSIQVEFYGTPANLHFVWDISIIEKWIAAQAASLDAEIVGAYNGSNWMLLADFLVQQITPQALTKYGSVDPIVWGQESFDYVRNGVYNYGADGTNLGDYYYNTNLPVIMQRLLAGGIRLAKVLNTLFPVGASSPADFVYSPPDCHHNHHHGHQH